MYTTTTTVLNDLTPNTLTITSPLDEWVAVMEDDWLKEQIGYRMNGDPWCHVIAIGMCLRLHKLSHTAAKARLGAILRGENVPNREREWFATLDETARYWVEAWALTAAEINTDNFQDVLDIDEEQVRYEVLLDCCSTRDDLEGVLNLLHGIGKAGTLRDSLEDLDPTGRNVVDAIEIKSLEDERLTRASIASPLAWWVQPVLWDDRYLWI